MANSPKLDLRFTAFSEVDSDGGPLATRVLVSTSALSTLRAAMRAGAQDGARAIEVGGRVRPDVVVLDLTMPVMGGREALGPILREVCPPPRVVILTMHDGAGQRQELLRMGARAFLAKSASLAEILAAVKGPRRA